MKRNLLGLVFLLCCCFAMGQVSAFTGFLQKFREVKDVKDMGLAAFGDAIISPDLDYASFHPYLSELRPESCAPEKCLWQSGSYVRKGDVVWVFLQVHYEDTTSAESKWFVENMATEYTFALYSKEGRLLAHQCVGRHDNMSHVAIANVRAGSFEVMQYELLKPEMLYGYQDLTYNVCRRRFVIRGNRKICVRQVEDYSQTLPHPGLTSNPPLDFEGFLRYFKRWDGGTDAGSLFTKSSDSDNLPCSLLLGLLPEESFCAKCWPRRLVWTPCCYIETKRSILCSMIVDCDFPRGGELPYVDYLMVVFDKDGKFQEIVNVMHRELDEVGKEMEAGALNDFLKRHVE